MFGNIIYSISGGDNNLLYRSEISETGAIVVDAIEKRNKTISQNISARVSKYFVKSKLNLAINANDGVTGLQQVLNSTISDIGNRNWGFGGKIEMNITHFFITEYRANWSYSKMKIDENANRTFAGQNHHLHLNFYLKKNQLLMLRNEWMRNNLFSEGSGNYFSDVVYRYTLLKKKIDLELQMNNVFNNRNFKAVSTDAFSYIETGYRLRPFHALVQLRFGL